jgi:hypothetical protein
MVGAIGWRTLPLTRSSVTWREVTGRRLRTLTFTYDAIFVAVYCAFAINR